MKPDTLEVDDMPYKILALKNFCIGQFGYPNFMGEIKGIKPDFEFNDGIDYLGSKMYQFEDFMLTELGSCKQFRSYLKCLEKINEILQDCPFIDAYKATNTFTGEIIEECKHWWESNLNLIFQPHLVKDFFENEVDHLQFQVTHLKMLEIFRFCSDYGFLQLATNKELSEQ